jgi:hypothetical protein
MGSLTYYYLGAVMKRRVLALTLVLALLFSVLVGMCLVDDAVCGDTLIVVVNSPQNRTYTSNDVSVSISASDPQGHIGPESVAYSVDGGPQIVIATVQVGMHSLNGSAVLSLANGTHSIVGVGITWFNGTDGVFYSSPVYFTVNSASGYSPTPVLSPSPEPSLSPEPQASEPFPTVLVVAVSLVIVAVAAGLLVYFRKRKS